MRRRVTWLVQLKALADQSRLRIVARLMKRRLSVNELTEQLKLSQYNVSKHLRVLRKAGIVDVEPKRNRREHFIAAKFRRRLAESGNVLDLGCCVFHFDKFDRKK